MLEISGFASDDDAILNAAELVFERFGVQRANAHDVAKRAGTSRSTLYRRYPSKEALYVAAVDRQLGRLMDDLRSATLSMSGRQLDLECLTRALHIAEYLPLLSRMAQIEPDRLVGPASRSLRPVVKRHRDDLESILGQHESRLDPGQAEATSGFLIRVSVGSLVCGSPPSRLGREDARKLAQNLLRWSDPDDHAPLNHQGARCAQ